MLAAILLDSTDSLRFWRRCRCCRKSRDTTFTGMGPDGQVAVLLAGGFALWMLHYGCRQEVSDRSQLSRRPGDLKLIDLNNRMLGLPVDINNGVSDAVPF